MITLFFIASCTWLVIMNGSANVDCVVEWPNRGKNRNVLLVSSVGSSRNSLSLWLWFWLLICDAVKFDSRFTSSAETACIILIAFCIFIKSTNGICAKHSISLEIYIKLSYAPFSTDDDVDKHGINNADTIKILHTFTLIIFATITFNFSFFSQHSIRECLIFFQSKIHFL